MEDGAKPRDLEDRTFRFAQAARAFVKQLRTPGEHRLPACCFRQIAEKLFELMEAKIFLQRSCVVGKLPTTAGWQPALPKIYSVGDGLIREALAAEPHELVLSFRRSLLRAD